MDTDNNDNTLPTGASPGPSSILRRNSGGPIRRNSDGTGGMTGPPPKRTSWADHQKRRNSSYSGVSEGSSQNSYMAHIGGGNYNNTEGGSGEPRTHYRTGIGSINVGTNAPSFQRRKQQLSQPRENSASASQQSRDSSDSSILRVGCRAYDTCCSYMCKLTLNKKQVAGVGKVRNHVAYQMLLGLSTLILLFGSQVQDLISHLPVERVDFIFNIIFPIVLAVLSVDIVLLTLSQPNYLILNFSSTQQGNSTPDEDEDIFGGFFGFLKIGSLMFWIDFMSAVSLLYDITFVNVWEHRDMGRKYVLVANGIISGGGLSSNRFALNPDVDYLISVLRSVRVIRYVRSISSILRADIARSTLYRICHFCGLDRCLARSFCCGNGSSPDLGRSIISSGEGGHPAIPSSVGVPGSSFPSTLRTDNEAMGTADAVCGSSSRGTRRNPSFSSSVQSSQSRRPRKHRGSQLGQRMKDLTSKHVALFIAVAIVLTIILTFNKADSTIAGAMVVLHKSISSYQNLDNSTKMKNYSLKLLYAATNSSTPMLFHYDFDSIPLIDFEDLSQYSNLREREKLEITVCSGKKNSDISHGKFQECHESYRNGDTGVTQSVGKFSIRRQRRKTALMTLLFEIFIILIWLFGVNAFAGPVMVLIVDPIERMVRLLGMLVRDPLGYTSTTDYQQFIEDESFMNNTRWTKEICRGMETSFLMSTILRIGSLMKVGFGSAGVEIIRQNLEAGSKIALTPSSGPTGSTVSCIFLFCDIRQFTNATECLQEEVFVFTNKIAAVVHSICHAYDGSANKNIGDAFLVSWLLKTSDDANHDLDLEAREKEADKALFSVVKICVALHHESFFLDSLSEEKKRKLTQKLSIRPGPIVQMGFGLHAGKAVQGAIGSHRKLDATYVSKAVELADYLEASTKKYGVKMLMSGQFHQLLDKSVQRRCRKVDQVTFKDDDDEEIIEVNEEDTLELYTFDIDVDALFNQKDNRNSSIIDTTSSDGSFTDEMIQRRMHQQTIFNARPKLSSVRRWSALNINILADDLHHDGLEKLRFDALELPDGPCAYYHSLWLSEEMKIIRKKYTDGVFERKFEQGLRSYCSLDWANAKQCFEFILKNLFDDGPSQYLMKIMAETNYTAPRNFEGFSPA